MTTLVFNGTQKSFNFKSDVSTFTPETTPSDKSSRIGFFWQTNATNIKIPFGTTKLTLPSNNFQFLYFTNEFYKWIGTYTVPIIVDLIFYPEFSQLSAFENEVKLIQAQKPNITFNYFPVLVSGTTDLLMESSGEIITEIYFNTTTVDLRTQLSSIFIDKILVKGTEFYPSTNVKVSFNGAEGSQIHIRTPQELTIKDPGSNKTGLADVSVTTDFGNTTNSLLLSYIGLPTINSISKSYGPVSGQTNLTIYGTNFYNADGFPKNFITFDGIPAVSYGINSPNELFVVTPDLTSKNYSVSKLVTIKITTPAGNVTNATLYTCIVEPTISKITFNGTTNNYCGVNSQVIFNNSLNKVTIEGTEFYGSGIFQDLPIINFNGIALENVEIVNYETIVATVPSGKFNAGIKAGSVLVDITTVGGSWKNYNDSNKITTKLFEYIGAPSITSIKTSDGYPVGNLSGNYEITITGSNFYNFDLPTGSSVPNVLKFTINDNEITPTIINSTILKVTLPTYSPVLASGSAYISLETPFGKWVNYTGTSTNKQIISGLDLFTFGKPPSIDSILIDNTPGKLGISKTNGANITISGNDFYGTVSVELWSIKNKYTKLNDSNIIFKSSSQIQCQFKDLNSLGSESCLIKVITAIGSKSSPTVYLSDEPNILSITDSSDKNITYRAQSDTTSLIKIVGTNFVGVKKIKFNSTEIDLINITIEEPTSITLVPPPMGSGRIGIYIENYIGNATIYQGYINVGVPAISFFEQPYYLKSQVNATIITGVNLYNTSGFDLKINGNSIQLSNLTFINSTQLNVILPIMLNSGPAKILLTNLGGIYKNYDNSENIISNLITFTGEPTISSFSPLGAHIGGQAQITINGSEFYDENLEVKLIKGTSIYTISNSNLIINSDKNQIKFTLPAVTEPGDYQIQILTSVITITSSNNFKYVNNPTITNISPSMSNLTGTNITNQITNPNDSKTYKKITITGTQFFGVSQVKFGNNSCPYFTVSSDGTTLNAALPSSDLQQTNSVSLTITTYAGDFTFENKYTYVGPPSITQISPNVCKTNSNTQIVITGTNFYVESLSNLVFKINGLTAQILGINTDCTQITCTTPTLSAEGQTKIDIETSGGNYSNYSGATIGTSLLAFYGLPTITSVSESSVSKIGGNIILYGTKFYGVTEPTAVQIGYNNGSGILYVNAISYTVNNPTSITIQTPSLTYEGQVTIKITNFCGTVTNSNLLFYAGTPTITNLSSSFINKMQVNSITITGTNFYQTSTSSLRIYSIKEPVQTLLNNPSINSSNSISVTIPIANISGDRTLKITTPYGETTTKLTYYGLPTISYLSENTSPLGGGTELTINGYDFYPDSSNNLSVLFGTNSATIKSHTLTNITITVPPGNKAEAVVITVTGLGGSQTFNGLFSYAPGPAIIAVSPNFANLNESKEVLLYGSNLFQNNLNVTINNTPVSNLTWLNDQVIKFNTPVLISPNNKTGFATINVTSYNVSATNSNQFLYYQYLYIRQNTSGSLEKSNDTQNWNSITWPLSISTYSLVTIYSNLTLTNASQYLILSGTNLLIDGNGKTITISSVSNYPGFIANGSSNSNGNEKIQIQNICIKSTQSSLAKGGGWVCQKYFGKGVSDITVTNCSSDGEIGNYSGGIFGSYYGQNGSLIVNKCFSAGNISGTNAGGIFGATIETEIVPNAPTGIVATEGDGKVLLTWTVPTANIPITNYQIEYSRNGGTSWTKYPPQTNMENIIVNGLTNGSGYIFRVYALNHIGRSFPSANSTSVTPTSTSTFVQPQTPTQRKVIINCPNIVGSITASNCYSIGEISGDGAGGIFADVFGNTTCTNSYSMGNITGNYAGGIYGINFYKDYTVNLVNSTGKINVSNCYSSGTISLLAEGAGGIYPSNTKLIGVSITESNCYIANGLWDKNSAINNLVGGPILSNLTNTYIGDVWTMGYNYYPFLLSAFGSDNYSKMSVTHPSLIGSTWSSESSLFPSEVYKFIIANVIKSTSSPLQSSTISTDGTITLIGFNNMETYGIEMISYDKNYSNKFGYNISTFYVNPVPIIKSVTPAAGLMNETKNVTITGKFFANDLGTSDISSIEFINPNIQTYQIDSNVISSTFINDSTYIVQVPANYFDKSQIIMEGTNGPSVKTIGYYYETLAPVLSLSNPATLITQLTSADLMRRTGSTLIYGITLQNSNFILRGTYFNKVSSVKIGNKLANSFVVETDDDTVYPPIQKITIEAPYDSPGLVDIVITNNIGSCKYSQSFEYILVPPVIESTSNLNLFTGTEILIYGKSFYEVSSIKFGTVECTEYSIISPEKIIVKVPANEPGDYTVSITNKAGTTISNFNITYINTKSSIYLKQESNIIKYSFDNSNWHSIISWPFQVFSSINIMSDIVIDTTIGPSGFILLCYDGITVEGNSHLVTISGISNYPGLFTNKFTNKNYNVTVQNLSINSISSTTTNNSGWFFPTTSSNVTINNCSYVGNDISGINAGGIFGSECSNITATDCFNTSDISGAEAGGIFGSGCSNINANYCYNNGEINGTKSGGIFGYKCTSSNAFCCFNTGTINGWEQGKIKTYRIYNGDSNYSGEKYTPNYYIISSVDCCYSSGGIYGCNCYGTASNCYNTGEIKGNGSGGIFGSLAGDTLNSASVKNSYNIGTVSGTDSGGIFGMAANSHNTPYQSNRLSYIKYYWFDQKGEKHFTNFVSYNLDSKIFTYNGIEYKFILNGSYLDYGVWAINKIYASMVNCYSVGSCFSPNLANINKTNIYEYTTWSDSEANTYLKTTDIWYSFQTNTPYLNMLINKQNYSQSVFTTNLSSTGKIIDGYAYKLAIGQNLRTNTPVNFTSSSTINQTNGMVNFGDSQNIYNYALKTLFYNVNNQSNYLTGYNFSDLQFTLAEPSVTSITPQYGNPGTTVEIQGNGLGLFNQIKFGNQLGLNFSVNSSGTIITAISPENLNGSYDVTLIGNNINNYTLSTKFTYGKLIIDFFTPDSGSNNTTLSLYGENLELIKNIYIGDVSTSFQINNSHNHCFIDLPNLSNSGDKQIKLTSDYETIILDKKFTYITTSTLYIGFNVLTNKIKTSPDKINWTDITSWPFNITTNTIFVSDITINDASQYFTVGSNDIKIDGDYFTVNIIGVGQYKGLFQNGKQTGQGYSNCLIKNIGVEPNNSSSLDSNAGWIAQTYFSKNVSGCVISNCYSTGRINSQFSGGIVGSNSNSLVINNCYTTGEISGSTAGGIAGSCENITISFCYSLGNISGADSYGICRSGQINNVYSFGQITGTRSTGICSNTSQPSNTYTANGTWIETAATVLFNSATDSWISVQPNTPYLLTSFNKNIYSQQNLTKSGNNYQTTNSIYSNKKSYLVYDTVGIDKGLVIVNDSGDIVIYSSTDPLSCTIKVLSYKNLSSNKISYNMSIFYANQSATITSFSPNISSIKGGDTITITGTNLNLVEAIGFGDNYLKQFTVSSTFKTITGTIPANSIAENINIVLYSPNNIVKSSDLFTYVSLPIIKYVSPIDGSVNKNSLVTIKGNYMNLVTDVKISDTSCTITNKTSTSITIIPPRGKSGYSTITLVTPNGNIQASDQFKFGRYV